MVVGVETSIGPGPHIVLYGMFGIGNTGNDATLDVTIGVLKERIPDARLTIVATDPEIVAARVGLPCVAIRPETVQSGLPGPIRKLANELDRWRQARTVLKTADCFIVPGTGIFDDLGATAMQHACQMWRWCVVARSLGVPVKFVSVGAGPVIGSWSRRLFRWTAALADERSYRDAKSRTFVGEVFKLDTSRDVVTPDLVFGLDHGTPSQPGADARRIGIGVMNYHSWQGAEGGDGDLYGPYMSKLAEFCGDLLDQGRELIILQGDAGDSPAVADLRDRLSQHSPEGRAAVRVPEITTLYDLSREISATDVVVATRYHTIVAAVMCGRPAISIAYAAKNDVVMKTFGLDAYCQNIWDFDLETLREHFAAASVNVVSVGEGLRQVGASLRQEVHEHLRGIATQILDRWNSRRRQQLGREREPVK